MPEVNGTEKRASPQLDFHNRPGGFRGLKNKDKDEKALLINALDVELHNWERKPKQAFETLDDALLQMRRCRYYGEVQPYVCDVCGKWHIGHYREK